MNVLDLFSGIGGFSLGLERAGMRTVAFCEIEPFARRVLARHWPGVPIYDDVRTLTADRLRTDGIAADVICGGFPCQDISLAGPGEGIEGARSGLWSEYARLIGEVRPRYVIVENVAALLGRGLDRVLADLAALGFDAEWHCIPASAVGAPHRRDRVWLVAYADGERWRQAGRDTPGHRPQDRSGPRNRLGDAGSALANAIGARLEGRPFFGGYLADKLATIERGGEVLVDADSDTARRPEGPERKAAGRRSAGSSERRGRGWNAWRSEPDVGRVAHGVPARVDRLRGLGNAVVPQIPELIGRAIMTAERVALTSTQSESN
jgi:DNA (cytosine-5)-methyltransferase 1